MGEPTRLTSIPRPPHPSPHHRLTPPPAPPQGSLSGLLKVLSASMFETEDATAYSVNPAAIRTFAALSALASIECFLVAVVFVLLIVAQDLLWGDDLGGQSVRRRTTTNWLS
jgi:hypothetical protein